MYMKNIVYILQSEDKSMVAYQAIKPFGSLLCIS